MKKIKGSGLYMIVIIALIISSYIVFLSINSTKNADFKNPPIQNTQQTPKDIAAQQKFEQQTLVVRDTDNIIGPEDASVTLIEYSDYQCPFCANFDKTLKDILKAFPNDVRLVYRDFPLVSIHQNSTSASMAAYAAAKQGKFWEMHDTLLKNQNDWKNLTGEALTERLDSYAMDLGLEMKFFKDDFKNSKSFIADSYNEALKLKLTGTPSLFINGVKTKLPSDIESFKQIIKNEIKQKNK